MKYDIIIKEFDKVHLKIIAKLMCSGSSISIHKSLELLEKLPVVYKKNLDASVLKKEINQLNALGVKTLIAEAVQKENLLGVVKISGEKTEFNINRPLSNTEKDNYKKVESKALKHELDVEKTKDTIEMPLQHFEVKVEKGRRFFLWAISLFVIILIFVIFLIKSSDKNRFKISGNVQINRLSKNSSSVKQEKNIPARSMIVAFFDKKDKKKSKGDVFNESQNYADSAELSTDDLAKKIKFYKIAISINNENFNAWNGLISVYREEGMLKEFYDAKEEMLKIFGNDFFSVEEIVRQYGKLVSFSNDEFGMCRLEYRSFSKKRSDLELQCYNLVRALYSNLDCKAFSIYGSIGKGKGLLIGFEKKIFPGSFSEFMVNSQSSFIE